jgi:hexokinase
MTDELSLKEMNGIASEFVSQLEGSKNGKKSSLSFIQNRVLQSDKNGSYQVMVFGGTVFEKAIAHKNNGSYTLSQFHKSQLPILSTKEVFLEFFLSHLDPSINTVAISFAYPLDPIFENNRLDGVLIKQTKDHTFTGLIGQKVGKEIAEYIEKKLGKKIIVTIANDTVCLVLSGQSVAPSDKVIGGIVGTGVNFGFFSDGKTIINCESGNFDGFTLSGAAHYVDQHSINPGQQLFEKEVAGGYLYKLLAYHTGHEFTSSNEVSLEAAVEGKNQAAAQTILKHSASLIACQIAGIYWFKKQPKLYFVMEGTLFWEGYRYIEWVQKALSLLNIEKSHIEFIKIEKSSLKGAAHLL